MNPVQPILALLAAASSTMMLMSCSATVDGAAMRQNSASRPPLQYLLPDVDEVDLAVGNLLDVTGPPNIGSISLLPNGIRDSSAVRPLDCLGVVTPLMQVVYENAGVRGVAWRDFARFGAGLTVSSAEAGVVRFDSDAEAARVFAGFLTQWRSCAGTTVRLGPVSAELGLLVTDVRVTGPVLSATIVSEAGDDEAAFPTEHAVGLAADCIVDVDVAITDPVASRRVATTRAADLATTMLNKIRAAG